MQPSVPEGSRFDSKVLKIALNNLKTKNLWREEGKMNAPSELFSFKYCYQLPTKKKKFFSLYTVMNSYSLFSVARMLCHWFILERSRIPFTTKGKRPTN